jgi:LuxR family transcriptional regulator, maltose regulon positive regulatory protein
MIENTAAMRTSPARLWADVRTYKLFAPTPYAGAIRRDGILERIGQHASARVVVLQGPAGHGKSTALQQLKDSCEAEKHLTGWLTFDVADNDPRRFFIHFQALVASLQETAGDDGEAAATHARNANERYRSDWMLDRLARIGRPVALFLDEFQTLSNKTVLSFFKEMFERAPDGLRIFIGSRSLPDVGLARLVVNNRALILRGDDLRFTPQEVERFFAASGELGIDYEEIDTIYQRTEGWPAALQLFRLTLSNPQVRQSLGDSNARAPRELAEYLAENVLAMQPARIQEFLLHTSLLTRLSAPLCDAVLERQDSREVLEQLERSGLFLRNVEPDQGWFKYHTLFSSILADQLRLQSPESAASVHRRAAYWHMEHRFFEDAADHAVACGDYSLAADALNLWSSRLVAGAHLMTVEHWYERLPFSEIAARPELAIKCCYALVFLRRRELAKPVLDLLSGLTGTGTVQETTNPNIVLSMAAVSMDDTLRAFSISERVPLRDQEVSGFAAFELGAAANLRGYCALATQDFEIAREYLALARAYNDRVDAAFSRGYTVAVSGVSSLLQGQLREALERFKEGMAEQRVGLDKSFASAALVSCYVWALYEANELDAAEALFSQHHDIISESTLPDFLTVAYISMARVHDARAQPAKAETLLDEASFIGHATGWTRVVRAVTWERVRRSLYAGSVEKASATAAANLPPSQPLPAGWIPFANDIEDGQIGAIRLALGTLELEDASARIDAAFKGQRGRVLRQIKLHLLQAIVALRREDRPGARRCVRNALRLAQPGRFVRCFLDEGGEIMQFLREEHQHQHLHAGPRCAARLEGERDFVEVVLAASGADLGPSVAGAPLALQPLTDREREMLILLANGISNKDIAGQLFVSANTVKFHLKNIYAKLSVTSRVQAMTAARQIGLISY